MTTASPALPRVFLFSVLMASLAASWLAWDVHRLGGNLTVLFFHGRVFSLPPELEATTVRLTEVGYDGQLYRLVAHDPWFQKGYTAYMDSPPVRTRRILLPALAWLAAFGQPHWIDLSYVIVSVAFVGLGVWWTARLAMHYGWPYWFGALFLLLPVTMLSLGRMLCDAPFAALTVGALLYARRAERGKLYWTLAAAALCKETGIFLIAGLGLSALWSRQWRQALAIGVTAVPFAVWVMIVRAKTAGTVDGFFLFGAIPFQGLVERFGTVTPYRGAFAKLTQFLDVVALTGCTISLLFAIGEWWRHRKDGFHIASLFFVALAAAVAHPTSIWAELYAYGRVLSPVYVIQAMNGFIERRWLLFLPILLLYPRFLVDLAA
jgi:4-amino-4-deoxy-L-arabinose transferase-like glycosyltransferase